MIRYPAVVKGISPPEQSRQTGHLAHSVFSEGALRLSSMKPSASKHRTASCELLSRPSAHRHTIWLFAGSFPSEHSSHRVRLPRTIALLAQGAQTMPKLETAFPIQMLHRDRSLDGSLPGLQDSHAVCRELATLLPSLHATHSRPSKLTLPALHRVHITSSLLQVSPRSPADS